MRSDTRRNQRRLMSAVGEISREAPDELTMPAIAARAEIGTATAYRYYSSIDEALAAYVRGVVEELRTFSEESPLEGRELFDGVLAKWMDLLDEHGPAIVQLRSRRGFLERLHSGNEAIEGVAAAWARPVRGLLAEAGLAQDQLEYALFLCNIILDPREISDLRTETDLSREEVAARLTSAYLGALRGWGDAAARH